MNLPRWLNTFTVLNYNFIRDSCNSLIMKLNYLLTLALAFCGFSLMAQAPLDPIQKVEIGKNREFIVNGKPFFPIMSWAQPAKNYEMLRKLNFNTFCGGANAGAAKAAGGYAITGFRALLADNGYTLAWIYSDEPDLATGKGADAKPRQTPEQVASRCDRMRATGLKHLIFMTLTNSFMKESGDYPDAWRLKNYPEYVKSADVVGFDYYPVYGWGYPAHLDWVGSGVRQLCELAGSRPVYAWIETSRGSKWMPYEKQPEVLPLYTRNEVWQAIINGATAIGYFSHAWRPDTTEFAPNEEMRKELAWLNGRITQLAPVILADPATEEINMTLGDELKCQFKATKYEGSLYIIAQNIDLGPGAEKAKQYDPISPRGGTATITVKGLQNGAQVEVVGEKRTITAEKGKFTDEFRPLLEHIYRIKL